MSILSEILATTRTEVSFRKKRVSPSELEEKIAAAPPVRGFEAALRKADGIALIAEVKKASPSKGLIREDFDPLVIAQTYEANGACCLSVLTDEPYFGGRLEYLTQIRSRVTLPLLRKDFIVDAWQIAESRAAGADAILLIVAALPEAQLEEFLATARQYDLDALVEVHDAAEMETAVKAKATLIGINNRDLHTFRTTLHTTLDLLKVFPPSAQRLIVSESGIHERQDLMALEAAGAGAVLVGEAMMREKDIGAKLRELLGN